MTLPSYLQDFRRLRTVRDGCDGGRYDGPVISSFLHSRYGLGHQLDDGLYDICGRIFNAIGPLYIKFTKAPGFPGGQAIRGSDIQKYTINCAWALSTEQAIMNVTEQLENNYEVAAALWDRYKARLNDFRSAVKNDVSSLDAAARKSTEATNKMVAAYGHVIDTLNSEKMTKAVENAERLAAAMQALAKLESHRLVLSVTEQDKTA